MIIDYTTDNICYSEKILNFKGKWDWICPTCGAEHSLQRHGTYNRNLISLHDNYLEEHVLKVQRLKCSSCNHTHAILPWDVLPFCIYSVISVIGIYKLAFIDNKSIVCLTKEFTISYQLIYHFIHIVNAHIQHMCTLLHHLGLLNYPLGSTTVHIINILDSTIHLPDFFYEYLRYYRTPLLLIRSSTDSYNFTFNL